MPSAFLLALQKPGAPTRGPSGGLRTLHQSKMQPRIPVLCSSGQGFGRLHAAALVVDTIDRGSTGCRHCRLRSMERRCLPAARALRGRAPDFGTGMKASDRREVGYTRPSGARERGAVVYAYLSVLLALAAGLRRALPAPAQGTHSVRIPFAAAPGPVFRPPRPTQPRGISQYVRRASARSQQGHGGLCPLPLKGLG